MNTKTMEGLAGARTNMDLLNTPFRVYKDARRRGDTATMERAMGYVRDFASKAEEYETKADEGMEEDAKEAREKAKLEMEKAIQKRKEESEKLEERMDENRKNDTDTVEVSEEGKVLLKDNTDVGDLEVHTVKADIVKEPVMYTNTGEAVHAGQGAGISVSI